MTGTTSPDGKFRVIHGNFSYFLALVFMEPTRNDRGDDVAKFRRDLDGRNGDILDFVHTVIVNEIEIGQIVKSKPMKLYSSHCHHLFLIFIIYVPYHMPHHVFQLSYKCSLLTTN